MTVDELKLGIYEKALPRTESWEERLGLAGELGFDFVEMSIDESDDRLARLEWSAAERRQVRNAAADTGISVPSICLSGHRRFPLGSSDPRIRRRAAKILADSIMLAADIGVRTIQIAGYDVYYEPGSRETEAWFIEGLRAGLRLAERENVMLAMEIMDYPFMNSIVKYLNLKRNLPSPWFALYPDVGNLSAWGNDVVQELILGFSETVAVHLKDTYAVTADYPGQFRDVPFGSGCVDFVTVFRTLGEREYRGPFLIEMWTEKSEDPITAVREARSWMVERMREGGLLRA